MFDNRTYQCDTRTFISSFTLKIASKDLFTLPKTIRILDIKRRLNRISFCDFLLRADISWILGFPLEQFAYGNLDEKYISYFGTRDFFLPRHPP